MIKPTKYLNLSTCIVRIASLIISTLLKDKVTSLSELEEKIIQHLGESSKFNFLSALNFLYLVGSIEYDDSNDAICLVAK